MKATLRHIAALSLAVALLMPAFGCKKKETETEETEETSTETTAKPKVNVMAGARYKTIPSTKVQVPIPRGWGEKKRGLYAFAYSGDKKALLAFTTVSSLGEYAGRRQHARKVFKITGCTKQKKSVRRIGPDRLKVIKFDAECSFSNTPAFVSQVLVDTGRPFPFIIYAVDKRAPKKTIEQAQQTILRIRRR